MEKSIQHEEISELVGYLRNIKDFEVTNYQSESSLANFSWGILLIFAGIADLNSSIFAGYSPHFIIWFFAVTFGFIIQNIISTQPLINSEIESQQFRPRVPPVAIYVMGIMFIVTIFIALYKIEFVLPYISLSLAILSTFPKTKKMVEPQPLGWKYRIDLHTLMLYVLTLILLIEGYFGSLVQIFQGLTFGLMFGVTSIYKGYEQRKEIKNKIIFQSSEEEMDQNSD